MSIFIQEVLNLLKRKKVKETLDLQYDYFEFGKKVKSTLNPAYGPKMEPFAIKSQDFVCTVTEGLTKTAVGSGATGIIPVYTSPSGFCLTKTLENSIITQTFDAFFNDNIVAINGGLRISTYLIDSSGIAGTAGQVLSSTGTETLWVDATAGSGTVTRVGALDGTFISSSSPDITVSGDLTYDLSATGTPSSSVFLRGDNQWSRAVQSFSNANGTFITATTHATATGDVDMGTVDLSATGTPSSTTYLRGDNTWATIPAGSGTVTSVALTTNIAAFQATVLNSTTDAQLSINTTGGTVGQFLRQDGTWATIPGGNVGTVTNVDATINGSAYIATVTDPTGAAAITIAPQGDITQYINGAGDLINLSTLPQGTVTSITNAADTGTGTAITGSGTFTYTGAGLISTAVTGTTVTISTTATDNTGTVTSVGPANGTFISSSSAAITTSGTLTYDLSASGTPSATTYLRGDNSWATIAAGSGTVTSIATGAGITGGTITDSGTITLDVNSSTATTDSANADWFSIANTAGTTYKIAPADIDLSTMNNDSGWTNNAGTVTSVIGGNGISISGTAAATVSIDLLNTNPGLSFQGFSNELAVDDTVVRTSGNQTIGGLKTFTDNVVGNGTFTGTNFILSSDERLKDNVIDLEPKAIDAKWKSFTMKDSSEDYRVGLIAQELEVTNPEFVVTDDIGFKSVKYIDLLISKIAELEARLEKAGI
jgi:hypothetical protein|tara:strand:- start:1953 stop:4094 length:2142 start_codon:yes stop_codon:yes gene_type:complete